MTTWDRIGKIDSILRQHKAPLLNFFNQGMTKDYLFDFFKKQNIYPNPALIALYEWHNGVRMPAEGICQSTVELMPMGIFYCLDEMIKGRQLVIDYNFMVDPHQFIPLFGSGEDDLHLLNNTTGEIYYFSPAVNVYGELEFNSIDSMLDFIIECYEEKIFTIDPLNGLEVRDDEYYSKLEKYTKSPPHC
jgi:hypothetical protein